MRGEADILVVGAGPGRTLEVLRPLAVTDALLARADIAPAAELRLGLRMETVCAAQLDSWLRLVLGGPVRGCP